MNRKNQFRPSLELLESRETPSQMQSSLVEPSPESAHNDDGLISVRVNPTGKLIVHLDFGPRGFKLA